jgi:hypothetical protein
MDVPWINASSEAVVAPRFSLRALRLRQQVPTRLSSGGQGFNLLTTRLPKPRLAVGGIRAGMVSLGQLGHGARAASTGRTQVGSDSRR